MDTERTKPSHKPQNQEVKRFSQVFGPLNIAQFGGVA